MYQKSNYKVWAMVRNIDIPFVSAIGQYNQ